MTGNRDIVGEAIGWHLRQAELSSAGWHDFVAWLEADPAHAAAYDRVALADRMVDELPMPKAMPIVANDADVAEHAAPWRPARWMWAAGGTAIAATVALLVLPLTPKSAPYTVTTQPGEQRNVMLADGTRVALSGATTVKFDHANPRIAELVRGEAMFAVHHDAGKPFTVRSGALAVQDVGTVFDLRREGARFDVAVAEGAVMFQPGREAILLKAGAGLSAREDSGAVTMTEVSTDLVGGWRAGRLAFRGAPLADVIADVGRVSGAQLVLDPDLSTRPFTGMVQLTGQAERDVPHLAALIGARAHKDGGQWVLSPTSASTQD